MRHVIHHVHCRLLFTQCRGRGLHQDDKQTVAMAPGIVLAREVRGQTTGSREGARREGSRGGGGGGKEEGERELTNVTCVVCCSEYELRSSVVARADVGHIGLPLHQNLRTVCVHRREGERERGREKHYKKANRDPGKHHLRPCIALASI